MCFRFSPDGTFRVEGLQWMTSFKDWRELMCFRFFLLMGHLELKTPVDGIVQDWRELMCFRFFSPDGTFRVEGLQWMTSFKDWRELMCFRFFS
ncbi:hypothetical protein TNCV_3940451 [Trichonephila clavipes]|uniref:Uncharacterized protein n=1 Tax=Trichonephila clavipes TaxID=2585209 RepID=A0A8X6VVT1_TRICX|nr:hypothetical protein TNCV_3940451 [Trichonephila clavipes]